jgi:hypothetical protein
MRHLDDLVNGMAATLSAIPPLVAALSPESPINAYVDVNPSKNSRDLAIYQMQPGELLVIWQGTNLDRGQMSKWLHRMDICVKCMPGGSNMALVNLIMDGVPIPGDGLIWRLCNILPGLLPTDVLKIDWGTDPEGVDYIVLETETAETGDWPNP